VETDGRYKHDAKHVPATGACIGLLWFRRVHVGSVCENGVEATHGVTLYRTQITFYHNELLSEVDLSVLMSQVSQYAGLNEVLVYWITCKQATVTEQDLKVESGQEEGACL